MIGDLTDEQKIKAKKAAQDYYKAKDPKPSRAALGFIKRNAIIGKTVQEIDLLISQAKKLRNGMLIGEGDKFKAWCEVHGRKVPNDAFVRLMNGDPFDARKEAREVIPTDSKLWRALCTYLAGRGRHFV